jgi:hypothetical protein
MDHILMNPCIFNTGANRKIGHLPENLARHAMERSFEVQNLARHEPECLIGCAAYACIVQFSNR